MNYKLYYSGPLMVIRDPIGERAPRKNNGDLASPPRMFVITYNEELNRISAEPIEWSAATALALDHVDSIGNAMMQDRMREAETTFSPKSVRWIGDAA